MQAERKVTGIGAHLAALGILISGGAMASMPAGPQWGWFSLIYPWLTLKQLLFLMILVLIGFSIKRSNAFRKYLKNGGDILDSQITDKWKGAYKISLSVYILVVVNTLLGLFKPY